jgi:hypothetical protein
MRRAIHNDGLVVGIGAALLVALLTLPLVADARATVSYRPPYVGAIPIASNNTFIFSPYGNHRCGAVVSVAPNANVANGRIAFADNVSARGLWGLSVCHVVETVVAGFLGPSFTAGSSVTQRVRYHWLVNWSAGTHEDGYVRIELVGNLYDNTSRAWVLTSDPTILVFKSGFAANYHHSNSTASATDQQLNLTVRATLVKGHQYLFYSELNSTCSALGDEYPGNGYGWTVYHAGSAWVNLAVSGNGAVLRSITVG